tara:strand:+ start:32 stop:730 length:699 start_codon:yes stop_codon:yes gene_type:complete
LSPYAADTHERARIAVDLAVLTVVDADLKAFLVKRDAHPFKHLWALPGGFVGAGRGTQLGEDLSQAAQRSLCEATGLPSGSCILSQLQTFGRSGRDPRGRTISVAWTALVPPDRAALLSGSGSEAGWFSCAEEVPWMRLAFDHADILQAAIDRMRTDIEHTDLAFALVPSTFTVGELRDVYEAVKGSKHDARNFRRRFQRLIAGEQVEEAPGRRHLGRARPAKVWRFKHNLQ